MLRKLKVYLVLGAFVLSTTLTATLAKAETIVASHYGFLFNTAPIAVAIERGEFKKRGVNITEVISSSGGGTTMRNQIAAGAGYGVVGTAAVLAAFREGHDVRIVSANVMSLADLFWVKRFLTRGHVPLVKLWLKWQLRQLVLPVRSN